MASKWPIVRFGDICKHSAFGPRFSSDEYDPDGNVACLRTMDIDSNGKIDFESMPIAQLDLERLKTHILQDGDLIITRTGAYLGKAAVFTKFRLPVVAGAFSIYFRLNRSLADPYYCRYFFNSRDGQLAVSSIRTGSAQPNLNIPNLHSLEIPLPPLTDQQAIVRLLGAFDDKIELNRRTNETLEAMARALFKSWFIDFDPVHAKAAGATTFPGMPQETFAALPTTFTNSELGAVPQGWVVKPAVDIVTVAIGKTPPRKEPQWFSTDPSNTPWASISDMGSCGVFIRYTSEYLTAESIERFNVRRIPPGSVLFSFKLTVGRVAITDGEITSNEAIAHFVPTSPDVIGPEYLYCYLSSFDHAQLGSTSSIATATNSKAIKAMPLLVPDHVTAMSFTSTVRPLFDMIRSLSHESAKLAALRDYLLPKLLSGQVRVKDAELINAKV